MSGRPGRARHVAAGTVLLAAAVSSCARYPQGWAPRSTADDSCSAVAGRYAATGEYGDPASRHHAPLFAPQLISYLRPHLKDAPQPPPVRVMDWVDISFDSDHVLRIRGYRNEAIVEEQVFAEKDGTLSCAWGDAKVLASGEFPDRGPIAGYAWTATYLQKAEDGSLILDRRSRVAGLVFMLLPIAVSDDAWLRFSPKR